MERISKNVIYFENENDLLENIAEYSRKDFIAGEWHYCSTTFGYVHLPFLKHFKFPCILKLTADDEDDTYSTIYTLTDYIKRANEDIAELEKEKAKIEETIEKIKKRLDK